MILITGGSGFVGRHLTLALVEHRPEYPIRVMDTRTPADEKISSVEYVDGSVGSTKDTLSAVRGVRVLVHLAAKVQPDSKDRDSMDRVNVLGTRNVRLAASEAGCELMVHVSSAGVYGHPRQERPFKETDSLQPVTPYQQSKWKAERELLEAGAGEMVVNILRPAGIYGPGSHLEVPTYRRVLKQRLSVELAGGVLVHPTQVRDVVAAIEAVIDRPAPHRSIYNVGGERVILLQDLEEMIALVADAPRRRVVLPPVLASPAVGLLTWLLAHAGKEKPNLRKFARGDVLSAAVDDTAFRAAYPAVPTATLLEGIREHLDWARRNSLI
jgi:nucleoside-diphosphate-sugar epimerase